MGPHHNIRSNLLVQSNAHLRMYSPANLSSMGPAYATAPATASGGPWGFHPFPPLPPHPNGPATTSPIPPFTHTPSPNSGHRDVSPLRIPDSGARHMYESSPSSSTGTHLSPWSNSSMSMYSTPASDVQSLPGSSSNSPYTSPSQHDAHSFEASAPYGEQAAFTGMPAYESRVFRDGLGLYVDGVGPLRTQQNWRSDLDGHIESLVGEDVFNTLDSTLSMSPIGFQLNGNAYLP